jgi:hypothetical protein
MGKPFNQLDAQIQKHFVDEYSGETDLSKVLDLSRFKDDIDGFVAEMQRQPAIYAYWANLRRIADENYDRLHEQIEIIKSRKRKQAIEYLNLDGDKKPSVKTIELKMQELSGDDGTITKYNNALKIWYKRKEQLAIIEKAVSMRESSFRSLSYLLSSMMKVGLYTIDKPMPSKLSRLKEHQ